MRSLAWSFVLLLASAGAVEAAEEGKPKAPESPGEGALEGGGRAEMPARPAAPPLDHERQFGVSFLPGIGYRVIFPYEEGKDCGDHSRDPTKRVCTNTLPLFLDVQGSYGLGRRLDVILDFRFGLQTEDYIEGRTIRQFALAPGIRYWVDPGQNLKFFATAQIVFDHTAQHQTQIDDSDWGFRNSNGLMYDFMRNVGVFVQFGETIGFVRWLRFELDGGVGAQVRFP